MNAFRDLLVVCALAMTSVAYAGDTAGAPPGLTEVTAEILADEPEAEALFAMCCWARGRAGFHYCEQYGICESDPEATCRGVGAAEGRTMSCKLPPPAEPGQGG
jgi:hypothetical protein